MKWRKKDMTINEFNKVEEAINKGITITKEELDQLVSIKEKYKVLLKEVSTNGDRGRSLFWKGNISRMDDLISKVELNKSIENDDIELD